jgi:hypothetical protein
MWFFIELREHNRYQSWDNEASNKIVAVRRIIGLWTWVWMWVEMRWRLNQYSSPSREIKFWLRMLRQQKPSHHNWLPNNYPLEWRLSWGVRVERGRYWYRRHRRNLLPARLMRKLTRVRIFDRSWCHFWILSRIGVSVRISNSRSSSLPTPPTLITVVSPSLIRPSSPCTFSTSSSTEWLLISN